jgi:predicted CXXCH cytochrome family protein
MVAPRLVAAALLVAAMAPAAEAYGANAYGQVFAGQQVCLSCHGDVGGKWQVWTYPQTAHGRFVTDVRVATAALVPSRTSTLWPSPAMGGSFGVGPADVWLQLGAPSKLHEYASVFRNDVPHVLSTGFIVPPLSSGPSDDVWLFNGVSFNTPDNAWEAIGPAGLRSYFQTCGGCHNVGVTRPTDTTRTLASGAVVGHSTETSYVGLGIQCESCHGTGSTRSSHWTTGVDVVRTKQVLKSQTCGQCHVNGTAKENNYAGKTFSSPNGFTTDRNLEDFFNVNGIQYIQRSPSAPAPSIPATDTRFFPDGHNKGMHHSYYNEWMLSGHARSLRYRDGSLWTSHAADSCLRCHSGEGFLKSIGYGANDGNDIYLLPSTIASDTLNVECAVCHTVHATTGDALGLRLPKGRLCQACHNADLTPGAEATPGVAVHHPQAEMLAGYGLIGVPRPAKPFMTNADCVDCHMPVTRETRVSHRFTPLLPGDAEAWGVQEHGDSCTPCHASRSRAELQADVDAWRADIDAGAAKAASAISAAGVRPASASPAGKRLLDAARTDLAFVQADRSRGAHNHPYAKAGLDKAAYLAAAVGASFPRFTSTAYDVRSGIAFTYGRLALGDGSPAAGELVTIEARPAGSSAWVAVGTVVTMAGGDFSCAVGPSLVTTYRARWNPMDRATSLFSPLAVVAVPSSVSIAGSGGTVRLGGSVVLSGRVGPVHPGATVTVQYRYGRYSWRTLAVRTLNSQSAYRVSFRPPIRGSCYFRAVFGGDAGHAGSASGSVALRVY